MNRRIGVLISGRGSNLRAMIEEVTGGRLEATIAVVISNRPEAAGLQHARAAGLATAVIEPQAFESRDAFDAAVVAELRRHDVGLVCLAGFMRLVGPTLLDAFPEAVLNVHPSLLPSFPGLDAQRQALEHGVRVAGCTVHFVTAAVDAGPILQQAAVPVFPDDTVDTLAARILVEEHRIYPEAIGMVLAGGWRIDGRRFIAAASPGAGA